jgi:hypothetical protein
MAKYAETFTLTYGDQAENHKGMQIIGKMATSGFNLDDLKHAEKWFKAHNKKVKTEIIHLNTLLPEDIRNENPDIEDAYLLIVRDGVNVILKEIDKTSDDLFIEQDELPKDTKAFMYGRVVNKKARHNLCFGHESQEPDYEHGKGRIVAFKDVPLLEHIRQKLGDIIGEKGNELVCEGNYYYDAKKCFIGLHGDSERKRVVGVRLGANFPLFYQWYHKSKLVSDRYHTVLGHGDLYIMSEKAVGQDWKRNSRYTLRHAAGTDEALGIKKN